MQHSLIFSSPEPKLLGKVGLRHPHTLQTSSQKPLGQSVKFHIELPWDGGTKVCSNDSGHMTKMATMPVYGKNRKKTSASEPIG